MPDFDFGGLSRTAQAAFRPHFVEVERRARRRRRRTRVAGASVLAAVVAVGAGVVSTALAPGGGERGSTGTAATPGRTPDFVPPPAPTITPGSRPGSHVRPGRMVAGDLRHLYLRYGDCVGEDCTIRVAATADGGATWRTSPIPVPNNSAVLLRAFGPRTVLAEVHVRPQVDGVVDGAKIESYWLSSTDGGANWRRVEAREVAVLPPTFQPIYQRTGPHPLSVLAADPATGEIVRLARKVRLLSARVVEGLPVSAGLWVVGYTGETVGSVREENGTVSHGKITHTGSAVEVSHDGGRTWRRSVLSDKVRDHEGFDASALAVNGNTAYAVVQIGSELRIYRSTDRGRSWRLTAARERVDDRMMIQAGVRPDGTLLIQAGTLAGEDPVMFSSTDGGESLRKIEVGPGASAVAVPGGYAQITNQDATGLWLSPDGVTWSFAGPPTLG